MIEHADTNSETVKLGKYRLLAELGHGGMAQVFLAAAGGPGGFGKRVVIKQILPHLAEDPTFTTMFLDEARLAARLTHPNVVHTHDVGEEDGQYFMVMEYLEGQPLSRVRHRLMRRKALPLALHLRAIACALAGLHHAHELTDHSGEPLEVVHRDVTPENIFVTYDGEVKVVDFGIAKARDSANTTQAGVVKGKVSYMAPEQARGEPLDRRVDVFAMGVILWEAAVGARLWQSMSPSSIMIALISNNIPLPRSVKPDLPDNLDAVIRKATAPRREDRYATAAELSAAVESVLAEMGEEADPRTLGKLVAEHFAEERTKLSRVADEQLRIAATRAPSLRPVPLLPRIEPTPTALDHDSEDLGTSAVKEPGSSGAFARQATSVPRRPSSRRVAALATLGAFTLIAAAFGAAALGRPRSPQRAAPASPALTTAAAALTPIREPPTIPRATIRISAIPASARIFLDGAPLTGNPFTGELPISSAEHSLRVEALGYVTRVEPLVVTSDRLVEVILEEMRRPDPKAAEMPAAIGPVTGVKARQLDPVNPYLR